MKYLKYILPLALIGILITPMFVSADFGVSIGDTFTYDCVASEMSVSIGSKSASVSGYTVDGHEFEVGTSVVVEVLEFKTVFLFGNTTIYQIQAGSYAENGSSNTLGFVIGSAIMMFYPMLIATSFVNESAFNETAANEAPGLFIIPFVDAEASTWTAFINLANELETGTSISLPNEAANMTIDAEYSDSTTEFLFEIRITGIFDGNYTDGSSIVFVDYEIDHHFQLSYQKTTGVMNGLQLEGTLTGTSNETALDLSYHQKTELEGYNLPNYLLGGGSFSFPGFGVLGAILAIGSFFAIAVIIRRRK